MKILGIDPGVALLGWGIIEKSSDQARCRAYGCLKTPAHTPLTERLLKVHQELSALIDEHEPDFIALETLFFVKNAKTLAQVGHARGVILLTAGQKKRPVFEYSPSQIKMALTGFGAAEKKQMQTMIQRLLSLNSLPTPDDAADALAVALCHAQFSPAYGRSEVTV